MGDSGQMTSILRIESMSIQYGRVEAVRDVSLDVKPGEFVSIIGNNGAGKSSTLGAIAGLVKPASGSIFIDGQRSDGLPPHAIVKRGVSLVPEGRLIFSDQTVADNLLLGAYTRPIRSEAFAADLAQVWELFPRLKERGQQLAGSLSGGEQQMLALARGLLSKPKLLMIDEMSLGLAPRIVDMLFPVLQRLNRDGLAILLVEQLATMALSVSERAYVFENSRVVLSGPSSELAENPKVMEAYLGRRRSH